MSSFTCSQCGHQEDIFGSEGARSLSTELDLPILVDIPINKTIRECADQGHPVVVSHPDSLSTQLYYKLADNVQDFLAEKHR